MTGVVVDCGDTLSIANVSDVYAQLLMHLAEGNVVKLDCSKIEHIDAAGLQILYSFSKNATLRGHSLSWTPPSESFTRSARLIGLQELMGV